MNAASVSSGRVHLDEYGLVREWLSLADLAADYWRYQRLSRKAQHSEDMAAWTCVHDRVGDPAWAGSLDLIDALLTQAADDVEISVVAAGPLEELLWPVAQGPLFIADIETRARQDRRWTFAVAGVWLDDASDAT